MIGAPLPGFLHGTVNAVAFAMTQFCLCLPVLYINRGYFTKGFSTLLHGAPNMDTLIAVGSAASLVYGIFAIYRMGYGLGVQDMELVERYLHDLYFESAVMILALINIGKYLEARSKGKTSQAIEKLMDMAPKTAFCGTGRHGAGDSGRGNFAGRCAAGKTGKQCSGRWCDSGRKHQCGSGCYYRREYSGSEKSGRFCHCGNYE